ncbi:hypothetical protein [Streptodolium elevatio]|uniref:Integral membrane protein n=1 Tax=Streptodolium elevatio TaxID=3157996 RepID=A0ABV3DD80_9ACTN
MSTNVIGATIGGLRTYRADRQGFLRSVLYLDAIVTGANGVAYLALAQVLDSFLGIDAAVLYGIGAFLTLYAIDVALVARKAAISRAAVVVIVLLNAAWAVGSITLAVTDTLTMTTVGTTWAIMQAAVVALFADLQLMGLRTKTRTQATPEGARG